MAFEGHKNAEYEYGRFVVNDIGDGIISELFPIYQHKRDFDNCFWKYAVKIEATWRPIFARSIAASGNSSNKLIDEHLQKEAIVAPAMEEQAEIGLLFSRLDRLITLHQRKDLLHCLDRLSVNVGKGVFYCLTMIHFIHAMDIARKTQLIPFLKHLTC